jgi:hypothetical protein
MGELCEIKYELKINPVNKAIPTQKEYIESLKGVLSQKQISKMKKEAINCIVKNKTVSFIECFCCKNFVRRIKGIVYCKGELLDKI